MSLVGPEPVSTSPLRRVAYDLDDGAARAASRTHPVTCGRACAGRIAWPPTRSRCCSPAASATGRSSASGCFPACSCLPARPRGQPPRARVQRRANFRWREGELWGIGAAAGRRAAHHRRRPTTVARGTSCSPPFHRDRVAEAARRRCFEGGASGAARRVASRGEVVDVYALGARAGHAHRDARPAGARPRRSRYG